MTLQNKQDLAKVKEALLIADKIADDDTASYSERVMAGALIELHAEVETMRRETDRWLIFEKNVKAEQAETRELCREAAAELDSLKAKLAGAREKFEQIAEGARFTDPKTTENNGIAMLAAIQIEDIARQALAVLDLNTIVPKKDTT